MSFRFLLGIKFASEKQTARHNKSVTTLYILHIDLLISWKVSIVDMNKTTFL